MSTLAVKIVLDTRRALIKNAGSKDPIYPIKLRVTFAELDELLRLTKGKGLRSTC